VPKRTARCASQESRLRENVAENAVVHTHVIMTCTWTKWAWHAVAAAVKLCLIVYCLEIMLCSESAQTIDSGDPSGHMKPLGTHLMKQLSNLTITMSVIMMKTLPSPNYFYEHHVKEGWPVVFQNIAMTVPAFELWKDQYLR
jgi:hypothetical protein